MHPLIAYSMLDNLPGSEAGRIGRLLGVRSEDPLNDISLADRVSQGLAVAAADALSLAVGRGHVVGPVIPEATLRRAKKGRKPLSREMSERLYEVGRVVDAVSRVYKGDEEAINRFLNKPHKMLAGRTPMQMAQSNSAGSEAVIKMLKRAESSFSV